MKSLHLNINDNPLVRAICLVAFPHYNGRKAEIRYNTKSIDLTSSWNHGSKSTFAIVRLHDNQVLPVPESHPVYRKINGIDDFSIPNGFVVVEHCIFQGKDLGLKIYTPADMMLIDAGQNDLELSRVQIMVLGWLVGLTSAGRKDAISRYHFPQKLYDKICQELGAMEYCKINKAGAVTRTQKAENYFSTRGKSASQINDGYDWGKCYDWQSRKFTGWAADIITEYQEKYNLWSK